MFGARKAIYTAGILMVAESKFGALAAVIARDISQIADLPEFASPPPGVWKLYVKKVAPKEINGKTALVIDYTILACIQLNEASDAETEQMPQLGGDNPEAVFGEAFWFSDPDKIEDTLSILKKKYGHLSEYFGTTSLLEILEKLEGCTIDCKITNRVDKNDKSKIYAQTRDIALAA